MIVASETDDYKAHFTYDTNSPYFFDVLDMVLNDNKFSTYDRDNDKSATENLAAKCGAGFWYGVFHKGISNINQSPLSVCNGFHWSIPNPGMYLKATRLYLSC